MARAVWKGSLSLGMLTLPISLSTGVSEDDTGFNQIHKPTGNRVAYKRVDAGTGDEVSYENIVKGKEVAKDTYVVVDPEELKALKPKKQSAIDITHTIDADKLDPRLLNSPYNIELQDASDAIKRGYKVMVDGLRNTGKVAIGTFVMREKEHPVAIYPVGDNLVAHTLAWPEQLRDLPEAPDVEVPQQLQEMGEQLLDALYDPDFDWSLLSNTYAAAVKELVEAKKAGKQYVTADEAEDLPDPGIDLMDALVASVEAAKNRKATGTES